MKGATEVAPFILAPRPVVVVVPSVSAVITSVITAVVSAITVAITVTVTTTGRTKDTAPAAVKIIRHRNSPFFFYDMSKKGRCDRKMELIIFFLTSWSDPVTGKPIDSGLFADIYHPLKPAFREYAVFSMMNWKLIQRMGNHLLIPIQDFQAAQRLSAIVRNPCGTVCHWGIMQILRIQRRTFP